MIDRGRVFRQVTICDRPADRRGGGAADAVGGQMSRGAGEVALNDRPAEPRTTAAVDVSPAPPNRPILLAISIAAVVAGLSGCAKQLDPSLYPTPEELFQVSLAAFHDGNCGNSDIGFRRLSFELPARDPKRAEVRYYLAECMFKRSEYLEASREYRRVADENARDSLAPQALLRSGEAYAKLWRRPELDATYGLSAMTTFQELLRRYPGTPAAAEGRERILTLNEWFAKKAYKAGVYYYRLKAFDSAILYFKSVVADYPATSFAAESLVKLVEAYDRIGYEEDREDMCQQIRRFYPDALGAAEACQADTTAVPLNR